MTDVSVTIPDTVLPVLGAAIRATFPECAGMDDVTSCYYYVRYSAENMMMAHAASQVDTDVRQQIATAQAAAKDLADQITPTDPGALTLLARS